MALEMLNGVAREGSVFEINLVWKDHKGLAMTPTSATWTLTTPDGTVINSREDIAITGLATTNAVVLGGSDLTVSGPGDREIEVFTVEGVYTVGNVVAGNFKKQWGFYVENLAVV